MYVVRDRQRKQIRQQEKSFAWEGLFLWEPPAPKG